MQEPVAKVPELVEGTATEPVEGTATKPVKAPYAIMTKFIGFLKFRHYRKKKRTFNLGNPYLTFGPINLNMDSYI
jgi:hypothetical protein